MSAAARAVAPTNTPQSGTNSDVFIAVVNQSTGKSEIIDLGITFTTLLAPVTGSASYHLDPNLLTNLGVGSLTYQLLAGDISNALANGFAGQTLYVSGNTQYSGSSMNAITIQNALSIADAYLVGTNMSPVNGYQSFVSSSLANNWGPTNASLTAPGKNLGQTGFDFSAAVGSITNLYAYTVSSAAADQPTTASVATRLGTVLLTGSTLIVNPPLGVVPSNPQPLSILCNANDRYIGSYFYDRGLAGTQHVYEDGISASDELSRANATNYRFGDD
jgi:hypothetical protein